MTAEVSPREIRAMLQQRLPQMLNKLFPHHSITFPVFTPLNPTRNDNKPGSFVIWTAGAAAGGFNEYSPKGPPASGDVIDLIGYVHRRDRDRRFALAWARDFLGLKQMDEQSLRAATMSARQHVTATVTQQTDQAKKKIARANELWRKTVPIAGSVAETYLASRRIPLMLVKNRSEDLRFIPRLEHWKSARWDTSTKPWRKTGDGPHLPAMVAALRNHKGDLTAVHCTFLRADGSGKADVDEPKLMRGIAKGSAIWLAHGPSGVPPWEAEKTGEVSPLIVSEGIENGLTQALANPEARCAAAGSFELMLALDVSAAVFDPALYAVDNDADVRHDDLMADHLDSLRALGQRAGIMRISGAKDSNALIMEEHDG